MTPFQFHAVTPDRWNDLETLFGKNGANAGCWCMFWRLERSMFKKTKGEGNRQILKQIVEADEQPGILAYDGVQAVGWCGIAPRENLIALENSRILKRVDEKPVWSITCFYVNKEARGQGIMEGLIKAAVAHAKSHGAQIVEAYPIDMQSPKLAGQTFGSYSGYMGVVSAFRTLGFDEVGQASETQLIMRLNIKGSKKKTK
ncbi:MAG: GNAT family N-acetyltransferase [Anaerolineales bacterium]